MKTILHSPSIDSNGSGPRPSAGSKLRRLPSFLRASLLLCIGLGGGTVSAQTYELNFSNSDLDMFGSGATGTTFGVHQSFADVKLSVGRMENSFFGRFGAEAGLIADGSFGIDFNFSYDSGKLAIAFPQQVTFDMGSLTQSGSNRIDITNVLNLTGNTQVLRATAPVPAFDVRGSVDLKIDAFAIACFAGCAEATHNLLDYQANFPIVDYNHHANDRVRLFGEDALSVSVENGLSLPIRRSLFLNSAVNELANFDIGVGAIEVNPYNPNYHNPGGNAFAVSGANAAETPILGAYLDLFGIAAASAGLPYNPLDIVVKAGPLKLQGKLFQLLAGGKFGVEQDFDFDPNMMVTFHANHNVEWSGGDDGIFVGQKYSLSLNKEGGFTGIDFSVPDGVDIEGLAIVPEVYLDNPTLKNHTAMTFGPSVLARALELKLTLKGVGLKLGPAFEEELIPTDIAESLDYFNETMNIGNEIGLSTRYFMPSLTGVGGGPSELTAYANVDVARGALVFETPLIGGTVTLRDETLYRNASQVVIEGRLDLVDAPSGAPNLYFGNGIDTLTGVIRVGANSILDATGANQDIATGGNASTVGQGGAMSNFVNADNTLVTGILDVGGSMYYNGNAIETIGSAAGVVIHGDGVIYANNINALNNLERNNGVLSIQNGGSVDTTRFFTNDGVMSVVGSDSTFSSNGYTNNEILEIGNGGRVDTTGPDGNGTFGNVDANGAITGTFIFSGGHIVYNGPEITTNKGTLVFAGVNESQIPFLRSDESDGFSSLHTNEGSIFLQATQNNSTEITFDTLTNTATGHIVLDVTNPMESSSGSSHLHVTNGLVNHGTLELTDNVSGTIDTNINQITAGWFDNHGTLYLDEFSTINANSIGNLQNGTLNGGDWRIDGRIIYEGGNQDLIRTIGPNTTLALQGEFISENAGGDSLHRLEEIRGTLIIPDNQHTMENESGLSNSGTLILGGLLDGTRASSGTVLTVYSLHNTGSVFMNDGAKFSLAGNLSNDDLEDPSAAASQFPDSVLVHADGKLTNLGDVTIDRNAQLFYGGYDISTIGTGTKLTFSGPTDGSRVMRLTMAQNNLQSYNAHDALRGLEAITGELHLTEGARFGNLLESTDLTLAGGGTLTIDVDSQMLVRDGHTLHVESGATLVNDGMIRLIGANNGSTLNFTGHGTGDAVLTGTPDPDAEATTDVIAASGVITMGDVLFTSPTDDELDFVITRQWSGTGAITTDADTRLVNEDQLIIGMGTIDTGSLLNRGIIHAEGDSGLSLIARQNLITNAGTLYAGSGMPEDEYGMTLSGFGGNRLTLHNSETIGGETMSGRIDVEGNLYITNADVIGGQINVSETGRLSLVDASVTGGDMSVDGQLFIAANSTSVLGGEIDLYDGSTTFVGTASGGAALEIAADGIVAHGGTMHLADGSSLGGAGNFNNSGAIMIDGGTVELGVRFENRIHMLFDSENLTVPATVDVVNDATLVLNNADGKVTNYGQINIGAHGGRIDIAEAGEATNGHIGTLRLDRDIQLDRPVSEQDPDSEQNTFGNNDAFGLIQLGGAVHVDGETVASGWGGSGVITGLPGGNHQLTNVANTIRGQGNIGDGMLGLVNAVDGTMEAPAHAHLVIQPNSAGFTNDGTVRAMADGEVVIMGQFNNFSANNATLEGGTYDVAGTLRFDDAEIQTLGAHVILRGSGQIVDQQGENAIAPTLALITGGSVTLDGSTLTTSQISRDSGSGTVTLDGGTLRLNADQENLFSGFNDGDVILTGSGGTIDNRGHAAVIAIAMSGNGGLTAEGDGILNLTGNNTYTGDTLVNEGIMLINGSTSSDSAVLVASGAAVGGSGVIGGDLTLAAGAMFAFQAGNTLLVDGAVTLDSSFGVGNILGIDASLANGVYTLIDGTSSIFASMDLENWGEDNPYDLGNGRSAYFSEGSLQLTVIPEPGTMAMMAISIATALGVSLFRKRKKG
ncbi:MAG: PEP-CTERM sorting domain-containing protein [Kiritimatiellae bacterium]|nr:PEP-CTERM sorting domain-containing protein [Kiritimatiellia bacterium]